MRFHETKHISQNFNGITLAFCEIWKYFFDFQFHFQYFQKMTAKFWFLLNKFEIWKFCTLRWWKLKKSISQLPIQIPTKLLTACYDWPNLKFLSFLAWQLLIGSLRKMMNLKLKIILKVCHNKDHVLIQSLLHFIQKQKLSI